MKLNNFDKTIDQWIISIDEYSLKQFLFKNTNDQWSVGQLFNHLIESTTYFLVNIKGCLISHENLNEELSLTAKEIFKNNQLPNIEIDGPDSNNLTAQPENSDSIKAGLLNLKDEFSQIKKLLLLNKISGKKKHPGLGYFNAEEWFQFAEIHLRHHFHQKNKLDSLLKDSSNLGRQ